jgi:hypothetical protein
MKNNFGTFFIVIISCLIISGCSHPVQPAVTTTITLKPIGTSQPTATFLPTFTPPAYLFTPTPFPIMTLTPLPKDIFDNFQGLSGYCKVETAYGGVPIHEEVFDLWTAHVSIDFDSQQYFPGDPIKLSAGLDEIATKYEPLHAVIMKVIVEDPVLKRHSFYLYDDGLHGDNKANDGIYTNVFDNTLDPGIYKFHLQLSGHTNRAEETITRECYIAKTVYPIPVPTATPAPGDESKSCRRIDAADPIVVRAENVGGNNSDSLGRYAFYPKAVSTGAGILVTWQMDSNGYMRLLNNDTNPIGDVNLLFQRNWISLSYSLVNQGNNAVLTYCGRYHLGLYDDQDRVTSAFLDPYGHLISEQARSPTNRVCTYMGGEAVWTGSRMLFASTDVVSSDSTYDTFLDIADANGNGISWRSIQTDASSNSPLAIGHGRVLIAVTTRSGSLAVHRFDLEGNELGEPAIIDPTTYETNGRIVTGYFRSPYVVPTTDGWLVIAASTSPGTYVVHLAPDGSPTSSPALLEPDLLFDNGLDAVTSYEGGAVILGETFNTYVVLFISKDGIVDQQWYPKEGEQPVNGSFFEHLGRLYLVYTSGDSGGQTNPTNQVLIRELQCVP